MLSTVGMGTSIEVYIKKPNADDMSKKMKHFSLSKIHKKLKLCFKQDLFLDWLLVRSKKL